MKRTEKIKQKNNHRIVHERTREEHEPTFMRKATPFFILLLLSGLLYLLFFSRAFDIENVDIEGYSSPELIKEIVDSHIENHYHGANLILFDTNDLAEAIKGDSGIRDIKISKRYPNTLNFKVEESSAKIIWETRGDYYEIDDRGYVIGKKDNAELPHVTDLLNIETSLGERVASPTFINYVITINEKFTSITGVEIEKINIYDLLSDVRVKSTDSWTVYLNASKDPVSQLENLTRVLSEASSNGNNKVKYIDMRLETRIYYK